MHADGENTLTLHSGYDAAHPNPGQVLESVAVEYDRLPVATDGQLWLRDATQGFQEVTGFSSPDILVVDYPGNYPVMVAQVETRETVTRDQARRVWKQLENKDAPLYIYVPSGYGSAAKDYAKGAGITHVKFRTWRHQPGGMMVEDI